MAAAMGAWKPSRFMRGMVSQPSTMTLATALPETVPKSALEMQDIFAGPPVKRPATLLARSKKNCPAPDFSRRAPKTMKRVT